MKKLIYFLLLLGLSGTAYAQFDPPVIEGYQNGDTVHQKIVLLLTGNTRSDSLEHMVEVSESPNFNGRDDMTFIKSIWSHFKVDGLSLGTSYYLRARVFSDQGISNWSQTIQLTVGNAVDITKVSGYLEPSANLNLEWPETYTNQYLVQFDSVADFSSPALFKDTMEFKDSTGIVKYQHYPKRPFERVYYRVIPLGSKSVSPARGFGLYEGFYRPSIANQSYPPRSSAGSVWVKDMGYFVEYRFQWAYDSLFTKLERDEIGIRSTVFTKLPFETDLYVRAAFIENGTQSEWSGHVVHRYLGPDFRRVEDGSEVTVGGWIDFNYGRKEDSIEMQVSDDSLFRAYDSYYNPEKFATSYSARKQFLRIRGVHQNSVSSWKQVSVFLNEYNGQISLNNVLLSAFGSKDMPPGGIFNLSGYSGGFSKAWIEIDVSKKFDSGSKIKIETSSSDGVFPDLRFDKKYHLRFKVLRNDGHEDQQWTYGGKFTTLIKPEPEGDGNSSTSVVRSFTVQEEEYFTGKFQFQLFKDDSYDKEVLFLDTIVEQNTAQFLLPFENEVYYRVRMMNKVDSSDWVESTVNCYTQTVLTAPMGGAVVQGEVAVLKWQDQAPECMYTVQIDTLPFKNKRQGTVFSSAGNDLPEIVIVAGKKYYWRAQAITKLDTSEWSEIATFVADDNSSLPFIHNTTVELYPNPIWNQVTVSFTGTAQVRLLNLQGQEILRKEGEEAVSFELVSLPAGMYFVEVHTAQGLYRNQLQKL